MPDSILASATPVPTAGWLAGSGQMAALVATKDWSTTPLGPIEQWPQSLRTTVSLCLASNLPISIAWGPGRAQIYNDGYWPLCGDKHPTSMGQDFKECWASAWEVLGEAFEQASAGQTRFLENQRMFLDRFGYLEETFFTFSFSPILDESGGVGGLFHPVTELTQQTLAARRLNILRTVAEHTAGAFTEPETVAWLLKTFREFAEDLPFVALYSGAPGAEQANLEGQAGLDQAPALAPATITLTDGAAFSWPLAAAARTGTAQRVEQLATGFGSFASGPYPEAPHTALVYPLQLGGAAQSAYFLVLGVSARRALDAEYARFFDLLAGATTAALSKARTLAEERQPAEALAELDRAQTAFSSNISHEFRTPLTDTIYPLTAEQKRAGQPAVPQPGQGQVFVEGAQQGLAETPAFAEALPADEATATILVVDNNADMRAYLQRILAQQPQWTVRTAADGLQALEDVARQRPDLILSDVMMPRLDGFGLLQALKQHPDTARIPVVLLSAGAGEGATVEGLDRDAADYLVKPFADRELLARVRTQLDIIRIRQDNTRLRAVEEELRKFKALSDHAFDAFILMRADGSFAYLNELARQRWGYTAQEVEQLRVPDVDPIHDDDKYRETFAQAQHGALPTFETLHRRKDGSTYPVEISMGGITLDGQPHMFAVARDITAPKATIEALHESEQRFRILADATPNMVWSVNPDSSIRYINQAFIDFVGVTPAQYEATGWEPYMHPDELENAQRTLTEAIGTRTRYTLEHRMRRHDGQYRWLLAQGAPSYFPNGELYGYVGSAIDITELKETNEQLMRTNHDLDNFVYTASHDLKAPISNIEGLLRLLEDLLPAELRTDDTLLPVLARMQDAVERFTRTIGHLTEVSNLQLEFAHPATPTALAPLIEDVRQDLQPLQAQTGGQLAVHVVECPTLLIAEKNLRSILYNLVSNALKYHHPDRPPVVRISCHFEGDHRVLRVQDNGLGLSAAQQAKLFGLFERLHTHVEGTGVGLYMVKKMVENAGGTISVQSREGEGSTFAMWFPA